MKRRQFISILGGAALAPLTKAPAFAEPETCIAPAARDDGWLVPSPTDDKLVDHSALCRMTERFDAASDSRIHAVLVARHGKLVFERYFRGSDEVPGRLFGRRVAKINFDADTLHDMKSVSKSVVSLALGIAIDRGLIKSVDEPIFSLFPELSDLRSPDKDRIRFVHALTMSLGLQWVEATPATGDYNNDEARMHMASDQCRYVMGLPVTAPAGQQFFYNTGALALVSAIVRKATGRQLDDFVREALFEPMGIAHVAWEKYRGETDAGGGLRLRPRDVAKFGQLVLAGGRWNDRQLVPRAWIEASTSPKLKATEGMSYGYLWWLGRSPHHGRAVNWIGAHGRGGQYLRIVPELDLVVMVTAGYYQDYSPQAFEAQYNVFKDVLRAVPQPG